MPTLHKLFSILTRREKVQILILAILMLIGAALETFGIGFIVPFISLVNNPQLIQEHKNLFLLYSLLGLGSFNKFLIFIGITFILFYLFKNVYVLFLYFMQFIFIFSRQALLSARLFDTYLKKPYVFHLQKNSAELVRNVDSDVKQFYVSVLQQLLILFTEISVTTGYYCFTFFIEPHVTLITILSLGICFLTFRKVFHTKIDKISKKRHYILGQRYKLLNQGFGTVKEIKVMGKESFFTGVFRELCISDSRLNVAINIINIMPRIILETVFVVGILVVILIALTKSGGISNVMSILILFTMAAFRLMPSTNRINVALASIRSGKVSVNQLYEDMIFDTGKKFDINNKSSINIKRAHNKKCHYIELVNLCYRYPSAKHFTIKDVSLIIPKASSVGLIGPSGSGKTTLVDIILGILIPTEGMVVVEGQNIFSDLSSWQKRIGYIPQTISLLDDTVRRNVAFGVPDNEINDDQVWKALESAQLKNFVESLPVKLETSIGERGVRLSGGQRQRIGIARALYYNPKILILDEATSSLDNDTEKEVMKAIEALHGEKTLIIVAHRHSTIQNCDIIFELRGGKLIRKVEKEQILAH